jgi:hypothetical protein
LKLNKAIPYQFLFLFFISFSALAQGVDKDYFRSPVKPGGRNYLSGNFAELRPNHFHTGLDYKFGGQEGEPIYAAADGWIHRIKISSFGYGNVIYIKHPSGHITLYGHLRNFNPRLATYIRKRMYEVQANDLEVYPAPGELAVKKGEQIANGGNTGSSGGPHLHFEIRDSLDRAMDPLLFGFPEIIDKPLLPLKKSLLYHFISTHESMVSSSDWRLLLYFRAQAISCLEQFRSPEKWGLKFKVLISLMVQAIKMDFRLSNFRMNLDSYSSKW